MQAMALGRSVRLTVLCCAVVVEESSKVVSCGELQEAGEVDQQWWIEPNASLG